MKNTLLAIAIVASLVFGNTLALADNTANNSGAKPATMTTKESKKGINEALVVENGKDSYVLHQPKNHPKQYFLPSSGGKIAGGESGEGQASHTRS
ncbi:hypothetical protein [Candidatus Nitronereus thalassa]|uniref:Uncharacterized protein n=1 Tax=Candidatus Nitronereus thalassa TaxID=3020898 RepID=A0ABU3KAL7_9BACT|nr:hypothetical protein [Candidatus Nitronereus thalassa]MDT7043358.1 hypothetical protein [Candidatus Nitronereus thalassa]